MIDQEHVHEHWNNLYDERSQNMSLTLKVGLCGIEEGETVDRRQELEKVLWDDLGGLLVNVVKEDDEFLGDVQQGSDGDSADEEVYNEGTLIEYADLFGFVAFAADFVG